MKKVIRLTESDLYRLVKRVIKEEETPSTITVKLTRKFINEYELFLVNPTIKMELDMYYKLGIKQNVDGSEREYYFATYRPEVKGINVISFLPIEFDSKLNNFLNQDSLTNIEKNSIKGHVRSIPQFFTGFESIEDGQIDEDGYFKIVSVG